MFLIENKKLKRYFADVNSADTVVIPDGVISIGGSISKEDRINLSKYTFDDPGFYQAFRDNPNLRCVYIPNSVRRIGMKSFEHCNNIKVLHLPVNLNTDDLLEFKLLDLDVVFFDGKIKDYKQKRYKDLYNSCHVVHCSDGDIIE